jgi:RNA polymerase-binding transcription factor DksA
VSDTPVPDDQTPPALRGPGGEHELEVGLAAFLPEGVHLAGDEGAEVAAQDDADADAEAVAQDEAVAQGDADEDDAPTLGEPPSSSTIDLDALGQIERDLDAVDAAIAALDAGTYGLDAATGAPLDDSLLAEDPTRLS